MTAIIQQQFQKVVNNVFSNWTALQLAIDHEMGGPLSKQIATQLENYIVDVCCNQKNISEEAIEDILLDSLEEEFNTDCEDNSPKEVSVILYRFIRLLKDGKTNEYEVEFNKLPIRNGNSCASSQIQTSQSPETGVTNDMEVEPSSNEEPLEEEGWTTIKGKRKR